MAKNQAIISIEEIVWDPNVYPRAKWSTSTIERYAEAMEAGDSFPPIILQKDTNILLDGKHTLEAYKKRGASQALVEWHTVPEGMSVKYYAAILSARHGDRLANSDLKAIAEEEFENDPSLDPTEWGKKLGLSQRTVYYWVSHILNRAKAGRELKAWRLAHLGWTQEEIGEKFGVKQNTISEDIGNCKLAKIDKELGKTWNEKGIAEWAERAEIRLTDAWAAALSQMEDTERLRRLDVKIQPYDVWHFNGCHDLMGDKHPGRIPGELVCHALYFMTKPGELVIDPMAGSGTTLDASLLMGRKARGYDIDERHARIDVEKYDLSNGWPDKTAKANFIFWDPPYFDKKDSTTTGEDGYIDGSISKLDPAEYVKWIQDRLTELHSLVKPGSRLAFLMSDWDPEKAKQHSDCKGIFIWDYVRVITTSGWNIRRQIQAPLPTQQVHPDIVNKFRESRRLARLARYLLVAEA